ncbi:MAG: hydantoinase/oxoprolinase N-terminal domain-containing protein [Paracoccaceae bacterium]
MTISLGVDTGGTYTDAVLIRDEDTVIASAKSLTTRHDLAIGIGGAVHAVLKSSGIAGSQIGLASLSTTLATNALVEGQGGRVALIYIGFQEQDLDRYGLRNALAGDPVLILQGGHTHAGVEAAPLDHTSLDAFLTAHPGISGFAVASQFAVRNPDHEQRATAMISAQTGRPVSASHQLSAKLGGPKRAMTAVLNARLIGMIDRLITRAETTLSELGITAPMMVVRGDGALISAAQARQKPIETILSGPAASIVGAQWMTGARDALVSDIGGTTTDIALLRDGMPAIDSDGARVGPYRTMVEAVAMRTTGLGGDSQVHFISEGLQGGITLGPRRVVPISLIAQDAPDLVHAALDSQLNTPTPAEHDGVFVRPVDAMSNDGLSTRDQDLLQRIRAGLQPLGAVLRTRMDHAGLQRILARGLVQIAAITPSDASHVLGNVSVWDTDAARKALLLCGRRRTGSGTQLAPSANEMAQIIVDQLIQQTSLALLEAAFDEDPADFGSPAADLARHALVQHGLSNHAKIVRLNAGLNVPVIGLGASAHTYYPAVGARLGSDMILPDHAGVANAIGAVVGRITMRAQGSITAPSEGQFRVHFKSGPQDFSELDPALDSLEHALRADVQAQTQTAGAQDVHVSVTRDIRMASVEARDVFVEATLTAQASGRPRIART